MTGAASASAECIALVQLGVPWSHRRMSHVHVWSWRALVPLVFAIAGCGDSSTTDTQSETAEASTSASTGTSAEAGTEDATTDATTTDTDTNTGDGDGDTETGDTDDSDGEPNGVVCFIGNATSCGVGEVCCESSRSGLICIAPEDACDGPAFACDGSEDCPALCCGTDQGSECADTCENAVRLCTNDAQCETGQRCCPLGGGIPFGALTSCVQVPEGQECDMPP